MSDILTSKQQQILTIRFNRSAKKNALSLDMYRQMTLALQQASADDEISTLVIMGSDECFTSGNDLSDFIEPTDVNEAHPVVEFLLTLRDFKKPIIAGVAGYAVGIGTTLLMHCDLVYAAVNAKFQLPFTHLGLCPEAGVSLLLPQMAGHATASELLLFGEVFDVYRAKEVGFVSKVIAEESVTEYAMLKAKQLTTLPYDSLLTTKRLLKASHGTPLAKVMNAEFIEFNRLLRSETCQKAIHGILN